MVKHFIFGVSSNYRKQNNKERMLICFSKSALNKEKPWEGGLNNIKYNSRKFQRSVLFI